MDIANTLSEKAYKKVVIYYFSGTGNSRNVAKWITSMSQEYQVECQSVNIAQIDRKELIAHEHILHQPIATIADRVSKHVRSKELKSSKTAHTGPSTAKVA